VGEIEQVLGNFSDDEVVRLQAAGELLDAYGYEFEDGHDKLAAAAEFLDSVEEDGEEAGGEVADDDDDGIVVDEDGNAFQYLGNVNEDEVEYEEDEKTAHAQYAAGQFMARGFHEELAALNGQ
jgi:hypothetical protein